jgi:predicted O-methyltransferase YrrM
VPTARRGTVQRTLARTTIHRILGPFERSSSLHRGLRQGVYLVRLPPRVRRFYVHAVLIALRRGDRRSLVGSTRPRELGALLRAAHGRRQVVEVGTGTAWTAISLVLSDRDRRVTTYDVRDYDERHWYLDLLAPADRSRLDLVLGSGPGADTGETELRPDLVFIDSSHEREETKAAFLTWARRVVPGAVVAFHDYGDPAWPGVRQAVDELRLTGRACGFLFLHAAIGPRA